MKPTSGPAQAALKEIRRATCRQCSAEEKIRIVLEVLRGEDSIGELCRREGSAHLCPGFCPSYQAGSQGARPHKSVRPGCTGALQH